MQGWMDVMQEWVEMNGWKPRWMDAGRGGGMDAMMDAGMDGWKQG